MRAASFLALVPVVILGVPMSEVTVAELDGLTAQLKELEKKKDAAAQVVTDINKEIARVEGRCVQYLKDLNRTDYQSPSGKIAIKEKWRVNLPADDIAKRDLFEHLRERGIFDKYATVNSASLNALYMSDWAEAKKRGEGMSYFMPGIEAPKLYEAPDFKPTKDKQAE